MKELDNFTVERLEELARGHDGEPLRPTMGEIKSLARIALAAKRAEPVAWVVGDATLYNSDTVEAYAKRSGLPVSPLYTTPQLNSQVPLGSWINCSDQMPENSTDVTLFHPEIGVFNGYCWRGLTKDKEPVFFSNSGEHDDGQKQGVTHWMPLPAAPEKENG